MLKTIGEEEWSSQQPRTTQAAVQGRMARMAMMLVAHRGKSSCCDYDRSQPRGEVKIMETIDRDETDDGKHLTEARKDAVKVMMVDLKQEED